MAFNVLRLCRSININNMQASNYKVEKGYFRGNPKYGRTTKLIDKATGAVVGSFMGAVTKKEMLKAIAYDNSNIYPFKI